VTGPLVVTGELAARLLVTAPSRLVAMTEYVPALSNWTLDQAQRRIRARRRRRWFSL